MKVSTTSSSIVTLLLVTITCTCSYACLERNLNFQNVQVAFTSLQNQMLTSNTLQEDPGLLKQMYDSPGFTGTFIESDKLPTQNLIKKKENKKSSFYNINILELYTSYIYISLCV